MRPLVLALVRLFPARFRQAYSDEMMAAFDDYWREQPGWRRGLRTVADLLLSGIAERVRPVQRAQPAPASRRGDGWMKMLWNDIRFAWRMLGKSPGFAAVVLFTLALGIGANTAIFSIVDAVLVRPLPFRQPEQLVRVVDHAQGAGLHDIGMSVPELGDLAARANVFDGISAVWPVSANLTGLSQPERIEFLGVSPTYFSLLGARAQIGRIFGTEDYAKGFADSVVISDGLWRRLFGGDPNILGKKIRADNDAYVVVGVMPPGFRHPGRTVSGDVDLWGTAGFAADPFPVPPLRSANILPGAIARLKPGLDLKQAQLRLDAFTAELRNQFPNDYRPAAKWSVELEPLQEVVVGKSRPVLLVLLGAVAMMLLIGCVNIANLLLARASGRHREIAVRQALGAARGRLVRQLLTESMLLSLLAGVVGSAVAAATLKLLLAIAPARIPRLHEVHISGDVLLFSLIVSVVTGFLFGLAPAMEASALSLAESLKEGGRGSGGSVRQKRISNLLVVSELAICMVLMIGAGLLVRSFWNLTHLDPGFDPHHVLAARLWLPQPNDPKVDPYARPEDRSTFVHEVLRRTRELPGVTAAAMTTAMPVSGEINRLPLTVEGLTMPAGDATLAETISVSPEYFSVMGTRLEMGRVFLESDRRGKQNVAIVDQSSVRHFWPGLSPIGKRVKLGRPQSPAPWAVIVGVVADIRHDGMDVDGVPHIYYSIYQRAGKVFGVLVRTAGDTAPLAQPLRKAVQSVDPTLPVFGVRTMENMLSASLAQQRFSAQMMALFAVLALGLAAIGIYGVLAYSIGQRTREIGIRIALGARAAEVSRMVLWQGMRLILAGTVSGLACALAISGFLTRVIFGVSPRDPLVFVSVPGVLVLVAMAASYLPAYRATRIDPMVALRGD